MYNGYPKEGFKAFGMEFDDVYMHYRYQNSQNILQRRKACKIIFLSLLNIYDISIGPILPIFLISL
jgi:hypothetical protein